jgi:hypothetical protein
MSDENQIRNSIQTYFDCINESSTDKVHAAFHPNAKITVYVDGNLREMSVADFGNLVDGQLPSPKEKANHLLQICSQLKLQRIQL